MILPDKFCFCIMDDRWLRFLLGSLKESVICLVLIRFHPVSFDISASWCAWKSTGEILAAGMALDDQGLHRAKRLLRICLWQHWQQTLPGKRIPLARN